MSINLLLTPGETQQMLACSFQEARQRSGDSREKAAKLTGVPAPTIRAFETKGQISLRQLLMLTHVYGDLSVAGQFFKAPPARTIDDLLQESNTKKTKSKRKIRT